MLDDRVRAVHLAQNGVVEPHDLGLLDAETPDPLAPALDVVAGYHAVNPLGDGELPLIGEFMLLRIATRIIVSQWHAAREPANRDYLLRRTPQAIEHFGLLRAIPPDVVENRIRAALEKS